MQPDPTGQDGLRMARYLSGISLFTRGIGIVGVLGSLIGMVAALNQRSSDDRLGFSLISLGVLLIAVVVWSTGTFHGTVARLAPLLVRLDERLDEAAVERRMLAARLAKAEAPAEKSDAAPPAGPTEANVFLTIEPAPVSPGPDTDPTPPPESVPRVVKKREPEPEPVRTPCPSCGGLIHPDATRCVHCMKRVLRA